MPDALLDCVDGYASMQASRCVLHRIMRSLHGARYSATNAHSSIFPNANGGFMDTANYRD